MKLVLELKSDQGYEHIVPLPKEDVPWWSEGEMGFVPTGRHVKPNKGVRRTWRSVYGYTAMSAIIHSQNTFMPR